MRKRELSKKGGKGMGKGREGDRDLVEDREEEQDSNICEGAFF